jgi:hypothetical protein
MSLSICYSEPKTEEDQTDVHAHWAQAVLIKIIDSKNQKAVNAVLKLNREQWDELKRQSIFLRETFVAKDFNFEQNEAIDVVTIIENDFIAAIRLMSMILTKYSSLNDTEDISVWNKALATLAAKWEMKSFIDTYAKIGIDFIKSLQPNTDIVIVTGKKFMNPKYYTSNSIQSKDFITPMTAFSNVSITIVIQRSETVPITR